MVLLPVPCADTAPNNVVSEATKGAFLLTFLGGEQSFDWVKERFKTAAGHTDLLTVTNKHQLTPFSNTDEPTLLLSQYIHLCGLVGDIYNIYDALVVMHYSTAHSSLCGTYMQCVLVTCTHAVCKVTGRPFRTGSDMSIYNVISCT